MPWVRTWAMVPTIQSGWGGQPGMLMTGVLMPWLAKYLVTGRDWVMLPLAPGMPPEVAQAPRASTPAAWLPSSFMACIMVR